MTVKKKRSDISLIEAKDSVLFREYISFVEQTATPDCLTKSQLTQPLPVRSAQKGR